MFLYPFLLECNFEISTVPSHQVIFLACESHVDYLSFWISVGTYLNYNFPSHLPSTWKWFCHPWVVCAQKLLPIPFCHLHEFLNTSWWNLLTILRYLSKKQFFLCIFHSVIEASWRLAKVSFHVTFHSISDQLTINLI